MSPPLLCHGWEIAFQPQLFARQYAELKAEVKRLKQELDPRAFVEHPRVKLLAAVIEGIKERIAADPHASRFALTGPLRRYGRLKGLGLPDRYRVFAPAAKRRALRRLTVPSRRRGRLAPGQRCRPTSRPSRMRPAAYLVIQIRMGVDKDASSSITSKGQVTIPKALRQQLGLSRGSRVSFELVGDHLEVRPLRASHPLPKSGFGMLQSQRPPVPVDFDPAYLLRP
jgi:AbrB family looped-hinge helix DNA binding protein